MQESNFKSKHGWSFCYPTNLQVQDANGDVVISDLRDPRNFFGFKIVLHARALADRETLADAIAAQIGILRKGAAKRDFTEVARRRTTLATLPADEVTVRYTLDAGRVEYTDPDGHSRSAGDDPVDLEVRMLATEGSGKFLAVWRIAELSRVRELNGIFDSILRSLCWAR